MRTIGPLRNSGTTRTRRGVALVGVTFGVLVATLGLGAAASGRVTDHRADHRANHHAAARTAADTTDTPTTNDYSGGRYMAADPNGGYWTVNWVGVVTAYGGAPSFGSPAASGIKVVKPIVAMAVTPDGQGYWLVGSDGGVFTYGDANFYGSTGAIHLNEPIVGIAATPDGLGYWLVASDGGIFTYGDASFYGSTGAIHLNEPIVGMAPTPDGLGYWLVASDGGIFTYGDATFSGSLSATGANVLGIIVNPTSLGYTLVASDGTASDFPTPAVAGSDSSSPASASETFTTQPTITSVEPDAAELAANCQPSRSPAATVDTALSSVFSNETGPGWIGGDATYSTVLPDGKEAVDFSDTLVGTAPPSGSALLTGFVNNSELVGMMPDLKVDLGGTTDAPQNLIPDTTPGDEWFVSATDVENGNQLIFVNQFAPVSGSEFAHFTGVSAIVVLSIPADGIPTYSSITLVPTDPNTQWGNAVMQNGDYNYIYGNYGNSTGSFLAMKLARVPLGESLETSAWQYWNGTQWVSGESNAIPLYTQNQLTGVEPQVNGVGYIGVSVYDSTAANTVDLSYACTPTGPWTTPVTVYTVPQVTQYTDEFAYIPTFHPELSSLGTLIVSYNIDTTDGLSELEQNVHAYQPQFIQLTFGG